jgi:hypothetical protein
MTGGRWVVDGLGDNLYEGMPDMDLDMTDNQVVGNRMAGNPFVGSWEGIGGAKPGLWDAAFRSMA